MVNRVPKSDASSFQPKISHVTLNQPVAPWVSWGAGPVVPVSHGSIGPIN